MWNMNEEKKTRIDVVD